MKISDNLFEEKALPSTGVIVVMSITNPARGGPSKAATPLRQVRIPKAEVNNSRPSKST